MPEVSSLANGEKRSSERVVLVGERPLAQAVKSFEHADPITLPCISPESRFDPGNVIGWLKKRFLKGLLLVKCAMILAKPVLPLPKKAPSSEKIAGMDVLLFEIACALKSTVDSKFPVFDHLKLEQVLSIVQFVMRKMYSRFCLLALESQ